MRHKCKLEDIIKTDDIKTGFSTSNDLQWQETDA
jgi:hypothetical protein